jgi:hypothetical protein
MRRRDQSDAKQLGWPSEQVVGSPHGVVAAGHAASYVLYYAARRSSIADRLVLIAPTWRGGIAD